MEAPADSMAQKSILQRARSGARIARVHAAWLGIPRQRDLVSHALDLSCTHLGTSWGKL
jgi:hypothetical protein